MNQVVCGMKIRKKTNHFPETMITPKLSRKLSKHNIGLEKQA
jgi:hypothetical protein